MAIRATLTFSSFYFEQNAEKLKKLKKIYYIYKEYKFIFYLYLNNEYNIFFLIRIIYLKLNIFEIIIQKKLI